MIDGLAYDGLTDVYNNVAMGLCAEKTANDFKMTRELLDDYTFTSYERNIAASKAGIFKDEIVPIPISEKETVKKLQINHLIFNYCFFLLK